MQTLTWPIRLETVTHMAKTSCKQELYKAHEKICRMLKNQDNSNRNQKIRDTYFEHEIRNA